MLYWHVGIVAHKEQTNHSLSFGFFAATPPAAIESYRFGLQDVKNEIYMCS